jgi:hypothetical protein
MSINDKYIKRPNCLSNVFLIEIVVDHDIINVNKKKHKSHIMHYVHYNEHHDPNFFIKKYYYYLFLLLIMMILSRATIAHGIRHITCMEKKNNCKKNICILFPQ